MNSTLITVLLASAASLSAQTITIFPDEYAAVNEGPLNSPNLPLALGTSRVQVVYEAIDLAIASGRQITQLGYRQDRTLTTTDTGRTLQLEIRMAYTTHTAASLTTNFANNLAVAPTTVFGPAAFTLPNLREAANPLANDRFFIPLTTPFVYQPANGNLVVEYLIYGNSGGGSSFNYRLDRGDYYSPVAYGAAGCPHSGNGTPNLTASGTRPGLSYSTTCSSAPGNTFGVLLIVPGQALLAPFSLQPFVPTINPNCRGQVLLANALQLSGTTNNGGSASWSFSIPNNPAYADFLWSSQAAFFDFFAPGGVVVSNGAQVLTGAAPRTSILSATGAPLTPVTGTVNRNYNPVTFFVHQ
jgi:hypothetical protein